MSAEQLPSGSAESVPAEEGARSQPPAAPAAQAAGVAPAPGPWRAALVGEHQCVHVWDLDTGEKGRYVVGRSALHAALSPSGTRVAYGSTRGMVHIRCVVRGYERDLKVHDRGVFSVAWAPDDLQLASGSSDKTVCIWNTDTWRCTRILREHTDGVNTVAWSPDCTQLATGSFDKAVRVWNTITWRCVRVLEHATRVLSAAWSPDGRRIASGADDGAVRIWDTAREECVQTLGTLAQGANAVAWSPDGGFLAAGSGWGTTVWDTASWVCVWDTRGRVTPSVIWSPDGQRLVSGVDDRGVCIWDMQSRTRVLADGTANAVSWNRLWGVRSLTSTGTENLSFSSLVERARPAPAPDSLDKYSIAPFVRGQLLERPVYGECSICSEELAREAPDEIFIVACAHWFHRACLQQWYDSQGGRLSCPSCRSG